MGQQQRVLLQRKSRSRTSCHLLQSVSTAQWVSLLIFVGVLVRSLLLPIIEIPTPGPITLASAADPLGDNPVILNETISPLLSSKTSSSVDWNLAIKFAADVCHLPNELIQPSTPVATGATTTTASSRDGQKEDMYSSWWWPSSDHWQRRAPYFMIIGAKKAGTTALFDLLAARIPHVLPPDYKEFLYFLPTQMSQKKWNEELIVVQQQGETGRDTRVPVPAIRDDVYAQRYYPGPRQLRKNNQSISFEATPGYLAFSTLSRIPLQCTFPWAKFLVILRDPVDRCFSHYNFLLDQSFRRNRSSFITEMTFEQYIQQDLDRLEAFGVLPPQGKQFPESFYGSAQERQAWYNYQLECKMTSCMDMVVARSLYTLQMEEWYDGLREMGRDPQQEILVVRNEDLKDNPDRIVQNVVDWLPLFTRDTSRMEGAIAASADKNSNSTGSSQSNHIHSMVTQYRSVGLSEETKSRLNVLFQRYNDRLYKLLGWNDPIQRWWN